METIPFPNKISDRLTDEAMDKLGEWVEEYVEKGVNQVSLIGLMEIYKTSLAYNLLEDEYDDDED
jgi:hypothetical protein